MKWSEADLSSITEQDYAEIVDTLKESSTCKIWLESSESGPYIEEDTENLCNRLDGLWRLFGADSTAWKKAYIGTIVGNYKSGLLYNELQKTSHTRLGEFVVETAFFALDLENEESGTAMCSSYFWLGNDHIIEVQADGEHWTDRTYQHPRTGEMIWPDDEEIAELETEYGIELQCVKSECSTRNDFSAIVQAAPSQD